MDIKLKLSLIGLFPGKLGLEFIGSPFVEQRRWEPRGYGMASLTGQEKKS